MFVESSLRQKARVSKESEGRKMNMADIKTGAVTVEGKTKCLMRLVDPMLPNKVLVVSKNDITAGDGAKHDVIEGKGVFSTTAGF